MSKEKGEKKEVVNKKLYVTLAVVLIVLGAIVIGLFSLNDNENSRDKSKGVYREFSSDSIMPGETFTLKLDIVVNGNERYYLVEESVPEGFDILNYESDDNKIKLFKIQNPMQSKTKEYQIKAPQEKGTYYFEGQYAIDGYGDASVIKGKNKIIVE